MEKTKLGPIESLIWPALATEILTTEAYQNFVDSRLTCAVDCVTGLYNIYDGGVEVETDMLGREVNAFFENIMDIYPAGMEEDNG